MSLKERIIKDIKSYQKSYKFVLYKAFFELTEDGVVVFDDIAEYFKKFYLERSINGLPVEESDAAPLISNISSNTPIDKIKTHLRNLPIKYNNFLRLDNDMVYMEQENWSQLNRHDIEEIISIINTTIESYYRGVEDMSEAKNIFLVIGDDTNYSRTITDFIDITKYKDIISETDYNNLMSIYPSGKMQCWGFQDNQSKNRCWDNMRYGDLCLMYNNSKIVMSGIVTYTLHSVKLSEEIWIQGDTPFEYIFCLNDVHILSIPSEKVLIDEFNYKRAYTLGASALSDEKFNRLIKEYGSISNFRKHIEDGDYKHISSNNNVQLNNKEKKKVNTKHLLFDFDIKDIVVGITNYISSKGFTYPPGLIENFYLSLKTKPFVLLAGVSGTGKTKLVKLFAEAIGCTEESGRFKMISVRPDWSDSSDLLGYKNIRDKFQAGPMIEVLQDAAANPDDIYFVCLDEMNLARVEYYFSDFLSIMETRRINEDGRILTSCLLDEDDFVEPDDKDKYAQLIIPDNLYIVGTVNMDETTHPFSKKVLDRANTIEFSEINLLDYSLSDGEDKNVIDSGRISNEFLKADYLTLNNCSTADKAIIEEVVKNIQEINDILEEASLQIGYRIRDEFCFYMIYNDHQGLIEKDQAFDFQLMQKILPRIQGSSRSIKNVLIKLYNFTTGEDLSVKEGEVGDTAIKKVEDFKEGKNNVKIKYPMSAEKLATMIKRIEEDGFTAYWL